MGLNSIKNLFHIVFYRILKLFSVYENIIKNYIILISLKFLNSLKGFKHLLNYLDILINYYTVYKVYNN